MGEGRNVGSQSGEQFLFGNVLEVGGYLLVFGYNIIEYLAVESFQRRFFGDDIVNNGLVETLAEAAGE